MKDVMPLHARRRARTVFLSDVHLGFPGCGAAFLLDFLDKTPCETLFLVGDIVDFWYLRRKRHWPPQHGRVIRRILDMAHNGTRVVLVPGNHDEVLRKYDGMNFGNLVVRDRFEHLTADGRRLLVIHGDQFDTAVRCSPWLAAVGGRLYDLLLRMGPWINAVRRRFGHDYWSLAAFLKHKVSNAMAYIERFERAVAREARRSGMDGVVCGHIHRAEIARIDGVGYFNCGDWVESCTALVEWPDGRITLEQWREREAVLKADAALDDGCWQPGEAA